MLPCALFKERKTMSGYFSGYLQECVSRYLDGFWNFLVQDPVMPQEPPSDARSEELDLPTDDAEDTDTSKTLKLYTLLLFAPRGEATWSSVCVVPDLYVLAV